SAVLVEDSVACDIGAELVCRVGWNNLVRLGVQFSPGEVCGTNLCVIPPSDIPVRMQLGESLDILQVVHRGLVAALNPNQVHSRGNHLPLRGEIGSSRSSTNPDSSMGEFCATQCPPSGPGWYSSTGRTNCGSSLA